MGTFTFVPPGEDWTPLFLALGVTAVFLLASFVAYALGWELIGTSVMYLSFLVGFVASLVIVLDVTTAHARLVNAQQVEGIESLGYDDVDLDGEFFTASDEDGKYVSGVLVDLGENKYTVLETKGATK